MGLVYPLPHGTWQANIEMYMEDQRQRIISGSFEKRTKWEFSLAREQDFYSL